MLPKTETCVFACADPESFVRGGPTLTRFFFDDGNTTISGPSMALQQNAMAFRWRADDGPTLNSGLAAFVIFQG